MKPVTIKQIAPQSALTLCMNSVIYLPPPTHREFFTRHMAVRFYYDPESRTVGIEPCRRGEENSVVISKTARAMQIRCGSLLRQFGIKLSENVSVKSLTRSGKMLTFVIPKKAMKEEEK